MSNIHIMPGGGMPDTEPVPGAIELLERLLAQARSGELRAVAVAVCVGQRRVITDWHSNNEYFALIGGVGWLHHRMLQGSQIEPLE